LTPLAVVVRIVAVLVAYLLACVAASIILTIGTLTPDWDDVLQLGLQTAAITPVIGLGALIIAAIAMLPSLLVIVLAEGFALRSSIVYAALGGAIALALSYGLDFAGYVGDPDGTAAHERQVLAAAGIAGGFVYWLFAGRKAGYWK
jgi:hypothetical protein